MSAFATAINCIDGRVQEPITKWLREHYGVQNIDIVTEPGPDKVFSDHDDATIARIKEKVTISIDAHDSHVLLFCGHHDCAANPGSRSAHIQQIEQALALIEEWQLHIPVIGAWINDQWQVEVVKEIEPNSDQTRA